MMLATTPQRAALQAGQRAAEIQQVQARLDSTEPLRCWPTAGPQLAGMTALFAVSGRLEPCRQCITALEAWR